MTNLKLVLIAALVLAGCSRGSSTDRSEKRTQPPPATEETPAGTPTKEPDHPDTTPRVGSPVSPERAEGTQPPPEAKTPNAGPSAGEQPQQQQTAPSQPLVVQPPMEITEPPAQPPAAETQAQPQTQQQPQTQPQAESQAQPPKASVPTAEEAKKAEETVTAIEQQRAAGQQAAPASPPEGPLPIENKLRDALKPEDRATELLASILTESNPERTTNLASQFADTIFEEPDNAMAKVMKVQYALRQVADAGLYDDNTAKRVAYVQAVLDERVKTTRNMHLLRDGAIIAGTSVALGVASGYRPLSRWWRSSNEPAGSYSGMAAAAETAEVAQAELRSIGMSPSEVRELALTQTRSSLPVQWGSMSETTVPGVRWRMVDEVDGRKLEEGQKVLVLGWNPLNRRAAYVNSRALSADEAASIERQLQSAQVSSPAPAGALETAEPPAGVQVYVQPQAGYSVKRALGVAVGSAIPFSGFYYEGYRQGKHYGGGSQGLYLESLVPPDKLRQIRPTASAQ